MNNVRVLNESWFFVAGKDNLWGGRVGGGIDYLGGIDSNLWKAFFSRLLGCF